MTLQSSVKVSGSDDVCNHYFYNVPDVLTITIIRVQIT